MFQEIYIHYINLCKRKNVYHKNRWEYLVSINNFSSTYILYSIPATSFRVLQAFGLNESNIIPPQKKVFMYRHWRYTLLSRTVSLKPRSMLVILMEIMTLQL